LLVKNKLGRQTFFDCKKCIPFTSKHLTPPHNTTATTLKDNASGSPLIFVFSRPPNFGCPPGQPCLSTLFFRVIKALGGDRFGKNCPFGGLGLTLRALGFDLHAQKLPLIS